MSRRNVIHFPARRISQRKLAAYFNAIRTLESALETYQVIRDAILDDICDGLPVEPGPLIVEMEGRRVVVKQTGSGSGR